MGQTLFSPHWYRVAKLKPRLNAHVQIYRHTYRGERWFLLRNSATGSHHRFDPHTYQFIGRLDGKRNIQEIWEANQAELGDQAPSQDEVIELLGRLHARDLLHSDSAIDTVELFERQKKQQKMWQKQLSSPLSVRFPLVSPNRFLKKYSSLVHPLGAPLAMVIWCVAVALGCGMVLLHWPELTHNLIDRVSTPQNLFFIWLIFPFVKVLHELAHAFAIRYFGGEVQEMGMVLLALTPIPYVEASASACFPNKWHRIAVSAAGVATELFLASLALFVWLSVEPGIIKTLSYNVMLISGVSTLLFNGNPLLRFDGYYILADLLEIPNLGQRSRQYLGYLFKKYILRMESVQLRAVAKGEKFWFVTYGIGSSVYRLVVIVALIFLVGSRFFFLGGLLAVWATMTMLVFPVVRFVKHLLMVSGPGPQRRKVLLTLLVPFAVVGVALLSVPVPLHTLADGVVWVSENTNIRAGRDCFVREIVVNDAASVTAGEAIIRCEDPLLGAEVHELRAQLQEVRGSLNAEPLRNSVQRSIWKEKLLTVSAALDSALEQQDKLVIRSPGDGLLVLPDVQNLPGRFVKQGQMLGYLVGSSAPIVRVVLLQSDISLVLQNIEKVELRVVDDPSHVIVGSILRETPAAGYILPNKALGSAGGGNIPVDPHDSQGLTSLEKIFQFDIVLPDDSQAGMLGKRVSVRFSHGSEPLARQWYRELRQLFLRRLNV